MKLGWTPFGSAQNVVIIRTGFKLVFGTGSKPGRKLNCETTDLIEQVVVDIQVLRQLEKLSPDVLPVHTR